METREERLAREQKHFKKKSKTTTKFKKGLAPVKEKNWKNKLLEGFDGKKEESR